MEPPNPSLRQHPLQMTMKEKKTRKFPWNLPIRHVSACVPRSQFLVPSISSMTPLISLFARHQYMVWETGRYARDNTVQPNQRLAHQGKTTTVMVHDFWLLVLVPVHATHTHTVWYSRLVGCCLCLTVFSPFSCRPWCTPSLFTLCPCPSFRNRTDVVTV